MILIAFGDDNIGQAWHSALKDKYEVYAADIHNRKLLEITLRKKEFEILILDLALLEPNGVNDIAYILELQPNLKIIATRENLIDREQIAAVLFGAKAYVSYDLSSSLIKKVISRVNANEIWVDRMFATKLLAEIENITHIRENEAELISKDTQALTPRETQIADRVALGANNRKIADELSISERTVKAHLGVIFRKLKLADRLQLALYMNRQHQLANLMKLTQK